MKTRSTLISIGLIGGIASFIGCFVPFFSGGSGSLLFHGNGHVSAWYYFAPAFAGLGTVALWFPRPRHIFAVFPLGAVGMAISTVGTMNYPGQWFGSPGPGNPAAYGAGAGFFLVTLGGVVLTVVWMALLVKREPVKVGE